MKVFTKRADLTNGLSQTVGVVGFVPTMGALHAGHISLVERCRKECGTVVVSIFVNPTQFNDPNDLTSYPRTPEADMEMLSKAGADIIYMPSVEDIYPEPDTRKFDFGLLDKVMEGAHRPGHFNGVAQVVSRLFDIIKPDRAYFGEKDFQQLAIIRNMTSRLAFNIEIVGCPIIRESDGLAMSSRNTLLNESHRKVAPKIYEALHAVSRPTASESIDNLKKRITESIENDGLLKVEYFSIVDAATLQGISNLCSQKPLRGCIAVQAGNVRLIDNVDIIPSCK